MGRFQQQRGGYCHPTVQQGYRHCALPPASVSYAHSSLSSQEFERRRQNLGTNGKPVSAKDLKEKLGATVTRNKDGSVTLSFEAKADKYRIGYAYDKGFSQGGSHTQLYGRDHNGNWWSGTGSRMDGRYAVQTQHLGEGKFNFQIKLDGSLTRARLDIGNQSFLVDPKTLGLERAEPSRLENKPAAEVGAQGGRKVVEPAPAKPKPAVTPTPRPQPATAEKPDSAGQSRQQQATDSQVQAPGRQPNESVVPPGQPTGQNTEAVSIPPQARRSDNSIEPQAKPAAEQVDRTSVDPQAQASGRQTNEPVAPKAQPARQNPEAASIDPQARSLSLSAERNQILGALQNMGHAMRDVLDKNDGNFTFDIGTNTYTISRTYGGPIGSYAQDARGELTVNNVWALPSFRNDDGTWRHHSLSAYDREGQIGRAISALPDQAPESIEARRPIFVDSKENPAFVFPRWTAEGEKGFVYVPYTPAQLPPAVARVYRDAQRIGEEQNLGGLATGVGIEFRENNPEYDRNVTGWVASDGRVVLHYKKHQGQENMYRVFNPVEAMESVRENRYFGTLKAPGLNYATMKSVWGQEAGYNPQADIDGTKVQWNPQTESFVPRNDD